MAEPLQKLFSQIRRPRPFRRAQYQPLDAFGGDTPGMRGTINSLDSQSMTDSAQGVDISSIAPPTRLASSRIDDELYQDPTPLNAGEEGGGERSPFMFASGQGGQTQATPTQYKMDCSTGQCQFAPVTQPFSSQMVSPSMAASTLPPGVTLGPGEQYVPGSLRELSGQMPPGMAMASAAPATTSTAAAQPRTQATPASDSDAPLIDPTTFLNRSQQQYDQALQFAQGQQAVPAMISKGQAQSSQEIGLTAAILAEQSKVNKFTAAIATRNADFRDRLLKAKTGELRTEMEQAVREDRVANPMPISRAEKIVRSRMIDEAKAGVKVDDKFYTAAVDTEWGVITALDAGHFLKGALRASDQLSAAGSSEQLKSRVQLIEGQIKTRLFDRYKGIPDPAARANKIAMELYPTYESVIRSHLKKDGQEPDDAVVQERATLFVKNSILDVESMIAGEDPFGAYFSGLKRSSPQAMQQEPARQAADEQPLGARAFGADVGASQNLNPWGMTPQPQ